METRKSYAALFDTLTRLKHVPDAHLAKGLLELTEAIEFEFRLADERMEAASFPGLHTQREWHARMLGALYRALPSVLSGNVCDARHILTILPFWLTDHFAAIEAILPADHLSGSARVWH